MGYTRWWQMMAWVCNGGAGGAYIRACGYSDAGEGHSR